MWKVVLLDPKTADWPFIASPWPTIIFVVLYLSIVKIGPKIMESRKAYTLKEVLIVYNLAILILSAWMVYEVSAEYHARPILVENLRGIWPFSSFM